MRTNSVGKIKFKIRPRTNNPPASLLCQKDQPTNQRGQTDQFSGGESGLGLLWRYNVLNNLGNARKTSKTPIPIIEV
jgi:hypothetical protein